MEHGGGSRKGWYGRRAQMIIAHQPVNFCARGDIYTGFGFQANQWRCRNSEFASLESSSILHRIRALTVDRESMAVAAGCDGEWPVGQARAGLPLCKSRMSTCRQGDASKPVREFYNRSKKWQKLGEVADGKT